MVVIINCKGTPYEMGYAHGSTAKKQIKKVIELYSSWNLEWSGRNWAELKEDAKLIQATLKEKASFLLEEIEGIAAGAGVDVLDIVVMNSRYEIGLSGAAATKRAEEVQALSVDGCTTFSERFEGKQWIGQNWDWQNEIQENLVYLNLENADPTIPRIKVVAEAGLLGQTGFNDRGVAQMVNALYASDLDTSKIPVTLIRRIILMQNSKEEALAKMNELGCAAVVHLMVADKTGVVSVETSPYGLSLLKDDEQRLAHSNHCIKPFEGCHVNNLLKDSYPRLDKMREMLQEGKAEPPSYEKYLRMCSDESNPPNSINRANDPSKTGTSAHSKTCYTIILNASDGYGRISFGRPTEQEEVLEISFTGPEKGVVYAN
ncbi:unnamed protein product [Kuraishia capsulata CBS 1993]|uniref:Peptidase C45 hydrolase domain-containing protein n=1 Tax=Kuraishia capsulata CBS 1993 TaxID=1382522 RepID=W6MPL0_9ASCO|nr:uncharacterized protein KUCA_T00004255001 [Kuraishia capsulata CBS 1993]CDK28273.1 unnamed protein product [Kuraishia capsulata CBS 1993]